MSETEPTVAAGGSLAALVPLIVTEKRDHDAGRQVAANKWPAAVSGALLATSDKGARRSRRSADPERQKEEEKLQRVRKISNNSAELQSADKSPLIHTDQFNASSGPLYVREPRTRLVQFQQDQQQQQKRKRKHPRLESARFAASMSNAQHQLAEAESSFSPAHVSILAADGLQFQEEIQDQLRAVARLEVLKLEVGSSEATLTFSLSLHTSEAPQRPDAKRQRARHRPPKEETTRVIAKRDTEELADIDEAALAQEETPVLRRKVDQQLTSSATESGPARLVVQPLPASTALRRPPARVQLPSTGKPESGGTTGAATTSESQTKIEGHRARQPSSASAYPSKRPTRFRDEKGATSAEPPMIKISSVPLHRITTSTSTSTSTSSPTAAATTTTAASPSRPSFARARQRLLAARQHTAEGTPSPYREARYFDMNVKINATEAPAELGAPSSTTSIPSVTTTTSTTQVPSSSSSEAPVRREEVTLSLESATKSGKFAADLTTTLPTTSTTSWSLEPETRAYNGPTSANYKETTSTSTTTTSTTTTTTASPSTTKSAPTPVRVTSRQQLITSANYEKPMSTIAPENTLAPAVQAKALPRPQSPPPKWTSKWFVRLRRFGSNEIDIVKVVVGDLPSVLATGELEGTPGSLVRSITFRRLEPSSAYELCIESASPRQQIGDQLHILNANHFLKCKDTSDVELSELEAKRRQSDDTQVDSTLRKFKRLDLAEQLDAKETTNDTKDTKDNNTNDDSPQVSATKLKSLCREFFTLPVPQAPSVATAAAGPNLVEQMVSLGQAVVAQPNGDDLARRPKTLEASEANSQTLGSNALRSHTELMEISYANESARVSGNGNETKTFEVLSSSSPGLLNVGRTGRASLFASKALATGATNASHHQVQLNATGGHLWPTLATTVASTTDYLPIVGCIFVLIFLATIANLLLNSMNCASSKPTNSLAAARARQRARRRASPLSPLAAAAAAANGSYYSATSSEQSGGSQTRILVVGHKSGTDSSFANAAAYFDLPNSSVASVATGELGCNRSGQPKRSSSVLNSTQLESAKQSLYMLSNSARFQLGPSFEGDERHNADMVGLARRNYDAFINTIYNADSLAHELANSELNSGRSSSRLAPVDQRQASSNRATSFLSKRAPEGDDERSSTSGSGSATPAGSGQKRLSLGARQRLRFDKVNPIYNMDSVQAASAYAVGGHQRASVSSFNPTGGGQLLAARHQKRLSTSSLKQQQPNQSIPLQAAAQQQQRLAACCENCYNMCTCCSDSLERERETVECTCGSEQRHCGGGADSQSSGAFSCCLDRQKQRLQEQQQQLGRVLTRNGALVPQPYISADSTGPPGAHQAVDMSLASLASSADELDATAASEETKRQDAPKQTFQLGYEDDHGCVSQEPPVANIYQQTPGESLAASSPTSPPSHKQQQQPPPPPPPPPPPTSPLASPVAVQTSASPSDSSVKVRVRSAAAEPDGTIDKADFAQRRNELESKLHLAGMGSK